MLGIAHERCKLGLVVEELRYVRVGLTSSYMEMQMLETVQSFESVSKLVSYMTTQYAMDSFTINLSPRAPVSLHVSPTSKVWASSSADWIEMAVQRMS